MDKVLNGRQENDIRLRGKIEEELAELPPIFTEYYHDMLGDGKSYITVKQYIRRVANFARAMSKEEIKNDFYADATVAEIKAYLTETSGEDSAAIDWSAIKSFYQFLKMNRYVKENPMDYTKRPKINKEHEVTYLTESEIGAVFSAIKAKADGIHYNRDMAIISLFLATGLRSSALAQINLSDLDMEHRTIRVIEKGKKIRTVEYGKSMDVILQNWLNDRKKYYADIETDALFVTQKRTRITYNAISDIVAKYTKNVDKHITPHKLRSTAATSLASQGANVQTIKEVLGHQNVQTTMRYITAIQKEKKQAVNTLDSLISNQERRTG